MGTLLRGGSQHFYSLEAPVFREDVLTFIRPLVDASDDEILTAWRELNESNFDQTMKRKLGQVEGRPDQLHSNWREFLYIIIRLRQPDVVVETGVFDGLSSSYILAAMSFNDRGELYSIDINSSEQFPGDHNAGWVVPERYSTRWNLIYDDAQTRLPELTNEIIFDMFLHDSLHESDHMRFEFEMAIEGLRPGGLLLSDNSRFNNEFWQVATTKLRSPVFWKNTKYALTRNNEKINDRLGAGIRR